MSELLDEIAGTGGRDAYDVLPKSIQCLYSREEWLWFSDREKADLVTNECMPETFDE